MGKAAAGWTGWQNAESISHHARANWNTWTQKETSTYWNGKRNIKKGYRALDVRHPEQFTLIGKLRARYPVTTLCHVFGVHRSNYKYWNVRLVQPDRRRTKLRSQVQELHNISHGSAGARTIATIVTTQYSVNMSRYLAGKLMKEIGITSCQHVKCLINRSVVRIFWRSLVTGNLAWLEWKPMEAHSTGCVSWKNRVMKCGYCKAVL